MGLFAPWFLAGLAGVALPLYLHLLRRHKTPPRPVPSLMLYESRVVSSTRHRRLSAADRQLSLAPRSESRARIRAADFSADAGRTGRLREKRFRCVPILDARSFHP